MIMMLTSKSMEFHTAWKDRATLGSCFEVRSFQAVPK